MSSDARSGLLGPDGEPLDKIGRAKDAITESAREAAEKVELGMAQSGSTQNKKDTKDKDKGLHVLTDVAQEAVGASEIAAGEKAKAEETEVIETLAHTLNEQQKAAVDNAVRRVEESLNDAKETLIGQVYDAEAAARQQRDSDARMTENIALAERNRVAMELTESTVRSVGEEANKAADSILEEITRRSAQRQNEVIEHMMHDASQRLQGMVTRILEDFQTRADNALRDVVSEMREREANASYLRDRAAREEEAKLRDERDQIARQSMQVAAPTAPTMFPIGTVAAGQNSQEYLERVNKMVDSTVQTTREVTESILRVGGEMQQAQSALFSILSDWSAKVTPKQQEIIKSKSLMDALQAQKAIYLETTNAMFDIGTRMFRIGGNVGKKIISP